MDWTDINFKYDLSETLFKHLLQNGFITRENLSFDGKDLNQLVHNDKAYIYHCRLYHDCDCYKHIDWDILKVCLQKGIITIDDLQDLKERYPICYIEILLYSNMISSAEADEFIWNMIENKFKQRIFSTEKNRLGNYIGCPRILSTLEYITYLIYHFSLKHKFPKTIKILSELSSQPGYYLTIARSIHLHEALMMETIYMSERIELTYVLIKLDILKPERYMLWDMYASDSSTNRMVDRVYTDEDYEPMCNLIVLMLKKGYFPIIDYEINSHRLIDVDLMITRFCEKIYERFDNLQGKCIISAIKNNIDLNILPKAFYYRFNDLLDLEY